MVWCYTGFDAFGKNSKNHLIPPNFKPKILSVIDDTTYEDKVYNRYLILFRFVRRISPPAELELPVAVRFFLFDERRMSEAAELELPVAVRFFLFGEQNCCLISVLEQNVELRNPEPSTSDCRRKDSCRSFPSQCVLACVVNIWWCATIRNVVHCHLIFR